MRRVSWQELREVCRLLGCEDSRQRGDHLVMTRPGLARPVVIKKDPDLGEPLIRTNMQTLGINRQRFEQLLAEVKGQRKRKSKRSKKPKPS